MLEEKIENVSFDEAKELAKKKGLAISKIQKETDPVERFAFYDKHNTVVAAYFPIKRFFLCSPPPKYKQDTPKFQRFTQKLIKRRFPDRPGLLNTTVRRYTEGEMPLGAAGFVGSAHELGAEILLDRGYRVGDPDLKYTLTHELVHKRREMDGEGKISEGDKEEIETELETVQRKGIVDLGFTDDAGYWLMLGRNWRNLQKQDYRTLTGREAPMGYDVCGKPVTDRIVGNINTRKTATNLWDIIRSGKLEKERERMFPARKKGRVSNPENIDTSYITSEGDKYHFFSPSGRAKPREIAKFIDRADGITGEEDIWQIMDVGKRLLISDRETPDKVIGHKKRKIKKSKDRIMRVLSFKFF